MTTTTLTCPACRGEGVRRSSIFGDRVCRTCESWGTVDVDVDAIRAAIVTTRGTKSLRKSMTSTDDTVPYGAYYVWRMARFNGGADVTMPMSAFDSLGCPGLVNDDLKAVQAVLDPVADAVARQYFGTDLGAARAWGRALGML